MYCPKSPAGQTTASRNSARCTGKFLARPDRFIPRQYRRLPDQSPDAVGSMDTLYRAVVIDLFSRSILGWKLADSLHSDVVAGALSSALAKGIVLKGALFHSDQGCQYSSSRIRNLLAQADLIQSMSARGYCYDNAFAESAFASIKNEVLPDGHSFPTRRAASAALFDYFETFYNRRRLHSSLGYLSPNDFLIQYFQNLNPHLN